MKLFEVTDELCNIHYLVYETIEEASKHKFNWYFRSGKGSKEIGIINIREVLNGLENAEARPTIHTDKMLIRGDK
jgi:hypothetical protein